MAHVTSSKPQKTWSWSDGSETSWMNWYTASPSWENNANYGCTYQYSSYGGIWTDVYCPYKYAYTCEMESNGQLSNCFCMPLLYML